MPNPWTQASGPPVLGQDGGVVTLLEGNEFIVADRTGDVVPGTPQGLFFLDTRFLSQWRLRVDGVTPEPLDTVVEEPYRALHVLRVPRHDVADAPVVVTRRRWLGRGLREVITLHNYGSDPVTCEVALDVGADFADLFEVKEGRIFPLGRYWQEYDEEGFTHGLRRNGVRRAVHIRFDRPPRSGPQTALWEAPIEPQSSWTLCIEIGFSVESESVEPRFRCGQPDPPPAASPRIHGWRHSAPQITTDHPQLAMAARQATEDLGILQIDDPEFEGRRVIAAGAPWFMTLFGRDSLLTAWMALLVDPDLARGVLHTLARFQGEDVVPHTEEEPGRILHELRFTEAGSLGLGGGSAYYGSIDSTPLFVMLLGEMLRWGLGDDDVKALLPHADRALEWVQRFGDRDGDGYVEYQRATERGLEHQGWKDSWDGTRFADGGFPQTPIALCEVQGYVYGAYLARAHIAQQHGDTATSERYERLAADLKARFNEDFWLDDRGWLAMGLDADKRPIDALTSNMGHCLWTGILDEDKAAIVADRLLSDELFSGYGIRTLATSMRAFNPISYHLGSVWPHDNAICISGLMRYGHVEHAHRAALALLDAAAASGGRLPELFCGFPRSEIDAPVPYPTSCSPQAWAAAAPLLITRTLLRFDPWIPTGRLWLDPVLPDAMSRLRVERIPLAGSRVTIDVEGDDVEITGVPEGVRALREPRGVLSARAPADP